MKIKLPARGGIPTAVQIPRRVGVSSITISDPRLDHNADREASAGIVRVVHVIAAIHIIDVDVVGVVPACWPRLNKSKPIAAVLKARISAHQDRVAHAEVVPTAKIRTETVVWDSTATPGTEAERWLFPLSGLFLL